MSVTGLTTIWSWVFPSLACRVQFMPTFYASCQEISLEIAGYLWRAAAHDIRHFVAAKTRVIGSRFSTPRDAGLS
jgi:hypothetical protein